MYFFVIMASVCTGVLVGVGFAAVTGNALLGACLGGIATVWMRYILDKWAYRKCLEMEALVDAIGRIETAIREDFDSTGAIEVLKKQLKDVDLECKYCLQANEPDLDAKCNAGDSTCKTCTEDCQCRTCHNRSNYVWVGTKEDEE